MRFDWTINITGIIAVMGTIVTIVGAYFGLQRAADTKFATLSLSIDQRFAQLALQLNTIIEGDIRELRERVKRIHDLSDQLNVAMLKIDRLERPLGIRAENN